MKVSELMTKTVASCRFETNLAAAGALMWESDCGFLPVVDELGKVSAVLTDRDICIALTTTDRKASSVTVGDVVRSRVKSPAAMCSQDDDVQTALKIMRKEKVRRLPVVSQAGLLEGVVALDDIVLRAEKLAGRKHTGVSCDDVAQTLQAICGHMQERKLEVAKARAAVAA